MSVIVNGFSGGGSGDGLAVLNFRDISGTVGSSTEKTLASMPLGGSCGYTSYDGSQYIYAYFHGLDDTTAYLRKYDVINNKWTAITDSSDWSAFMETGSIPKLYSDSHRIYYYKNKLYIFDYMGGSSTVYCYDISTNTTSEVGSTAYYIWNSGGGIINDKVYLHGYYDSTEGTFYKIIHYFDLLTNTSADTGVYATFASSLSSDAVVCNDVLYMFQNSSTSGCRYNVDTNTVTAIGGDNTIRTFKLSPIQALNTIVKLATNGLDYSLYNIKTQTWSQGSSSIDTSYYYDATVGAFDNGFIIVGGADDYTIDASLSKTTRGYIFNVTLSMEGEGTATYDFGSGGSGEATLPATIAVNSALLTGTVKLSEDTVNFKIV